MVVIFNLPCSKAVSWRSGAFSEGGFVAVNTKGRTNFSEQINSELDAFSERWLSETLETPPEKPNCSYRPKGSFTVVSNTSNLCIVRLHYAVFERDRANPVNGFKAEKAIGEEIIDYYIYVDAKNKSVITKFETVKDTYTYNDGIKAENDI